MTELSDPQKAIVDLPLTPLAITACAGSGKTLTAVHRLASMRRMFDDDHGLVALLSFSNVAVDTFRKGYFDLMRIRPTARRSSAIEIDTVDGFITTNILRPHGHRVMASPRTPFLVEGREPFLKGFTVFDGSRPHPTVDLKIRIAGAGFQFSVGRAGKSVATQDAERALAKLGKVGAYTHESGRYWVLRVLREQPAILRALVRRYPHILIDEAQDIGAEHQAILELMIKGGSELSLIGDCNQGIYEFSGANGAFLAQYGGRPGITARELDTNFRSVPSIVEVANQISGKQNLADRDAPDGLSGAFFIPFKKGEREKALATFASMCATAGIGVEDATVICRSSDWADTWSGSGDGQGQGVVRCFADAVICRDRLRRMGDAFHHACAGFVGLLADEHSDLLSGISRPSEDMHERLRKKIWAFVRDPQSGLPAGSLKTDCEWHPRLSDRAKNLIENLSRDHGLTLGENLGHKLARKALDSNPLVQPLDLAEKDLPHFRVSTVHKVKGESLGAVMYVVSKEHLRALLDGTTSEVGRIGYVAVTRARNLLILAIPDTCISGFEADLAKKGFRKPGAEVQAGA